MIVLQPLVHTPGLSPPPPFAHHTLHIDRANLMRRPSYEAPAVKRELPRDRSKVELRVIGNGCCPSILVSGRIG